MFHWLSEATREEIRHRPQEFLEKTPIQVSCGAEEFFAVAMAYHQIGDAKRAEQAYRMALQKNFCHLPSIYGLAMEAFRRRGGTKDARNLLKRALRMDSKAAEHAIHFQRELKYYLDPKTHGGEVTSIQIWCLQELEFLKKGSLATRFQLGKLLFEKSQMEDAIPYLKEALEDIDRSQEATEYLSYIFEHLYKGEELVEKTLELAEEVPDRSDLFFNLAMVCQHEQKRLDLALHFFYLATQDDPHDPGLRFSLEQACLELIGSYQKSAKAIRENAETHCQLMMAHIYQGSLGVAQHYA